MNAQLNYMIARHRSAELQRAGEQARLAREADAGRRKLPDPRSITCVSAQSAPRSPRGISALEIERAIGSER
jgi:hypothetical protein